LQYFFLILTGIFIDFSDFLSMKTSDWQSVNKGIPCL